MAVDAEHGIIWNDPDLGIEWPMAEKDQRYGRLKDVEGSVLPGF